MWETEDVPIPVSFWRLVVAVIFLPLGVFMLLIGQILVGVFCLIIGLVCVTLLLHRWFELTAD
jgi:uncharacterized membrane protein (DUF2068 family)